MATQDDSEPYTYPIRTTIKYDNDDEYRQSICKLFRQHAHQMSDYDDEEFYALIHYIETHTGTIPEFRTLYIAAAAHLISEEVQVGIVVLLSYDYLFDFHTLLCEHFTSTSNTNSNTHPNPTSSETYTKLLRMIKNHTTSA